jgi:hypothetical protein
MIHTLCNKRVLLCIKETLYLRGVTGSNNESCENNFSVPVRKLRCEIFLQIKCERSIFLIWRTNEKIQG